MNASLCNNSLNLENFSIEEKIQNSCIRVIVTVNDKRAKKSRVIFDEKVGLPKFVGVVILMFPFVVVLFFTFVFVKFFTLFKRSKKELSYEEAKEYFSNGNGYLQNLSKEKKERLSKRTEGLPLGL